VNVAARLEGLADPGGLCLSGTAYETVRGKLDLQVEDMGEQRVKNIARPVRVYRAQPAGGPGTPNHSTPEADTAALELPRCSLSST
jgi:class 3 adenylate cyclase